MTDHIYIKGELEFYGRGIGQEHVWKTRFYVLKERSEQEEARFDWYETEADFKSPDPESPRRSIYLQQIKSVAKAAHESKEFVFQIHMKDPAAGDSHLFCAPTAKSLHQWLDCFEVLLLPHPLSRDTGQQKGRTMSAKDTTPANEDLLYKTSDEYDAYPAEVLETDASKRCEVTGAYELRLHELNLSLWRNKKTHVWPYRHIRRYGRSRSSFTFEAGRKCRTGEGLFTFKVEDGTEVFSAVSRRTQAMKEQEAGKHQPSESPPSSSPTTPDYVNQSPMLPKPNKKARSKEESDSTKVTPAPIKKPVKAPRKISDSRAPPISLPKPSKKPGSKEENESSKVTPAPVQKQTRPVKTPRQISDVGEPPTSLPPPPPTPLTSPPLPPLSSLPSFTHSSVPPPLPQTTPPALPLTTPPPLPKTLRPTSDQLDSGFNTMETNVPAPGHSPHLSDYEMYTRPADDTGMYVSISDAEDENYSEPHECGDSSTATMSQLVVQMSKTRIKPTAKGAKGRQNQDSYDHIDLRQAATRPQSSGSIGSPVKVGVEDDDSDEDHLYGDLSIKKKKNTVPEDDGYCSVAASKVRH